MDFPWLVKKADGTYLRIFRVQPKMQIGCDVCFRSWRRSWAMATGFATREQAEAFCAEYRPHVGGPMNQISPVHVNEILSKGL